jgi:hypothetical protein
MKRQIKVIRQPIPEINSNADPENRRIRHGQPFKGLAFCNSPSQQPSAPIRVGNVNRASEYGHYAGALHRA